MHRHVCVFGLDIISMHTVSQYTQNQYLPWKYAVVASVIDLQRKSRFAYLTPFLFSIQVRSRKALIGMPIKNQQIKALTYDALGTISTTRKSSCELVGIKLV